MITLLEGIAFIVLGICILVFKNALLIDLVGILGILLALLSIYFLFVTKNYVLACPLLLSILITVFPYYGLVTLVIVFGLFCIIDAVGKLITYYGYRINKIKWRYILLADALFYMILGISICSGIIWATGWIYLLTGIFLIRYGLRFIRDGYEELTVPKHHFNIIRRFRTMIPLVPSAIIPILVLFNITRKVKNHEELDEIRDDNYDIEVMIHTAPDPRNMMGHVDLCIGNIEMTYGNYDFKTYRLHDTIGEGVLIIAPKDKYINFSQDYLKKTLVGFGIKLTKEQRERVDAKLVEIFSNIEPWAPRAKRDPEHAEEYREYSSMLYKATGAQFYKMQSGRFKNFWLFGTNCVLFADSILGRAGTDRLNFNDFISPGNYYDYFNHEFKKKKGIVVSKKVYTKLK